LVLETSNFREFVFENLLNLQHHFSIDVYGYMPKDRNRGSNPQTGFHFSFADLDPPQEISLPVISHEDGPNEPQQDNVDVLDQCERSLLFVPFQNFQYSGVVLLIEIFEEDGVPRFI
jgi:hypothetical protein